MSNRAGSSSKGQSRKGLDNGPVAKRGREAFRRLKYVTDRVAVCMSCVTHHRSMGLVAGLMNVDGNVSGKCQALRGVGWRLSDGTVLPLD
jgi:hypothetical protein